MNETQEKIGHPEINVEVVNDGTTTWYYFQEGENEDSGMTVPASMVTEIER